MKKQLEEEFSVWYRVSIKKGARIQETKVIEVSNDLVELRILNESFRSSNHFVVKRRSTRVSYFETKQEAKDYLSDYWNGRVNKTLEELKKVKSIFREVQKIKTNQK